MTNKISCLATTTLTQLALGEVLPDELHDIEEHVTDCERCRQSAQMVEDDPDWTNNILPVLKAQATSPSDEPQTCADNGSILRLLGPTDDPNMLGRIGSYEIAGIIGRGGMGIVFKAFDASLDRFVAIKMLLPHLAALGAARKRFSREAQAAAAVIDDHVLPIYSVDQWQGVPYLVTQYSRGMTLQKRIHEQGPLELKEILRIGLQTARGLAAAHAQGLVHRDVKPSNILLDGTVERALLTDFGLARAADDASVTRTGAVTGTPQYMSPEQVRGELVDARSDLFSLGSTLYAMCTGRSPFRADSTYGVMHRITEGAPSPIQEVNPDIPQWLCDVVTKLMANRPDDRFESAQQVAELLEECLAHVQQPAAVPLPKRCRELRQDFGPSSRHRSPAARRSPMRRRLLLLILGFAMCLAGVLIVLETGKGKLTIESAADGVPIRITQDGDVVKRLTVDSTGAGVRVAAGQYRVEIDGDIDGLAVNNGNAVTLERRGEEIVRIVYSTRSPAAQPKDFASGADDFQPALENSMESSRIAAKGDAGPDKLETPPRDISTVGELKRTLIGTWQGGRSLVPVRHTFRADGSYEFMIPPEYTNGITQPKPGKWSLVGDQLSWEIAEGAAAAHIERIDKDIMVFRDGSVFRRIVDDPPEDSAGAANDETPGVESFHGMSLAGSRRTNTVAELPDLFYADPPGSYKIRPRVVQVYAEVDGTVYYLPDKNVFYVQHDPVGSSKQTYYGPFDGNPEKVMSLPKIPTDASAHGQHEVSADYVPQHFVRIVADRNKLLFEGMDTTWEELPRLLEQIQQREATVLEVAIGSDQLTLAEVGVARGRAELLARQFGFQYSSYVGVHQPAADDVDADGRGSDNIDRRVTSVTKGMWTQKISPAKEEVLLDLESGRTFGPIDIGGDSEQPPSADLSFPKGRGLVSLNMLVLPLEDDIPDEAIHALALKGQPPSAELLVGPDEKLPKYFAFQTSEGSKGILLVEDINATTGETTLRYRLVERSEDVDVKSEPEATQQNTGDGNSGEQAPTADALLSALQEYDQTMEAGFTVEGTKLDIPGELAGGNLPPTRRTWKLSMSSGKFGYESRILEVLRWQDIVGPDGVVPPRDEKPDFAFELRQKIFLNQETLADYCYFAAEAIFEPGRVEAPTDDNLGLAKRASLTTHPANEAHRYGYKNDPLWAMGRGYSPFITQITSIKQLDDGYLAVAALGKQNWPVRWELLIDPKAGYLVREAKYIWSDEDPPGFVITTSGTQWIGNVSIPQSYQLWEDTGYGDVVNSKIGGTFTQGKASADVEFLKSMESILAPPYPVPTQVVND